jgi:hypothetical protein
MPEAEGGALASEGGGDGSRGLRRSRLRGGISPAVGRGRRGAARGLPIDPSIFKAHFGPIILGR